MALKKINYAGAGRINASYRVPDGLTAELRGVMLHLSAAPTTAGFLTLTLDAAAGAAYDTVLSTTDLAGGATKDFVFLPTRPLDLLGGDALTVVYANANGLTYGLEISVLEAVT